MKLKSEIFSEHLPVLKAFLLGFTAMAAQIILLREFLLVFYGNELIIGILIALWMALTALGVVIGKYIPAKVSTDRLLAVFGFIPLMLALFVEVFRNTVFDFGRMPGLYEIIVYSGVVLSIFCLPNGIIFSLLNKQITNPKKNYRIIYAFEAMGSLTGGLVVSFVFIGILDLNNFTTLLYLLAINLFFLIILQIVRKRGGNALLLLGLNLLVLFIAGRVDLNRFSKSKLFKGQTLRSSTETPFGNITVTGSGKQTNVYTNGQLVFSSETFADREESVHYALLQRPRAKTVLQIGGGLEEVASEILKYKNIQKVVHLEPDKMFFDTINESKKVIRLVIDPVLFLRNDTTTFDAILLLEPAPENARFNRFYTVEFFQKIKKRLDRNGIFSLRLPASENYLDNEELLLHSVIYNSLHSVFKQVLIVPGRKNYFLASDSLLTTHYSRLYQNAGISNRYVNPDYIKDNLLQFRSDQIHNQLIINAPLNRDFKPTAYLLSLKHWMNYYGNKFHWLSLTFGILMILFLLLAKPDPNLMFSTGFAGASMEIVFLLLFQVLYGYIYFFLGVMVSVFMAGLAAGSLQNRIFDRLPVINFLFLSLVLTLSVPILLFLKNVHSGSIVKTVLLLLLFIIAFFNGNQYRILIGQRKTTDPVVRIYSSDLAGAMLGGFLTAIWLIPEYGIIATVWGNIFLLFLTLVIIFLKKKLSIFRR